MPETEADVLEFFEILPEEIQPSTVLRPQIVVEPVPVRQDLFLRQEGPEGGAVGNDGEFPEGGFLGTTEVPNELLEDCRLRIIRTRSRTEELLSHDPEGKDKGQAGVAAPEIAEVIDMCQPIGPRRKDLFAMPDCFIAYKEAGRCAGFQGQVGDL